MSSVAVPNFLCKNTNPLKNSPLNNNVNLPECVQKPNKCLDGTKPISILKRTCMENVTPSHHFERIIFPKLPYHKRWELYLKKRNEIFNVSTISENIGKPPKRSTNRLRQFYKRRKLCKKLLVSALFRTSQI